MKVQSTDSSAGRGERYELPTTQQQQASRIAQATAVTTTLRLTPPTPPRFSTHALSLSRRLTRSLTQTFNRALGLTHLLNWSLSVSNLPAATSSEGVVSLRA
jgi:hypothetical protein